MQKSIFKKEYSEFRSELRRLHSLGLQERYIEFFSNSKFKEVRLKHDFPVSLKIELHKMGILKPELRQCRGIIS